MFTKEEIQTLLSKGWKINTNSRVAEQSSMKIEKVSDTLYRLLVWRGDEENVWETYDEAITLEILLRYA
jgi:hypothetical protein